MEQEAVEREQHTASLLTHHVSPSTGPQRRHTTPLHPTLRTRIPLRTLLHTVPGYGVRARRVPEISRRRGRRFQGFPVKAFPRLLGLDLARVLEDLALAQVRGVRGLALAAD